MKLRRIWQENDLVYDGRKNPRLVDSIPHIELLRLEAMGIVNKDGKIEGKPLQTQIFIR